MLPVCLALLTAVTFVLMIADPRPTDSTEVKSAWREQVEQPQTSQITEVLKQLPSEVRKQDIDQA